MDTPERDENEQLLLPGEVATRYRVSARSLRRWNALGILAASKTPGGHRRYRESDVRSLLAELEGAAA